MTTEDRDLLLSLRRQQGDLQQMLERLNAQLRALETRTGSAAADHVVLPPLPPEAWLPPVPLDFAREVALPPIPLAGEPLFLPPVPPAAPVEAVKPSLEFRLGWWLTRIGALFVVMAFVFLAAYIDVREHIDQRMGPAGKLAMMGLASGLAIALGQRCERRKGGLLYFGRALIAVGLGGLYTTFYSAYFDESLRVIRSAVVAGFLLFAWSIYALLLAERKKSQGLGLMAVVLAYFSTAMNPVGAFTMTTNMVLAAITAVFLLRNGWVLLATISATGAYLALLRRLVIDDTGELAFDTSQAPFWPHAIYLIGVWFIFTLAVIFATERTFRGVRRLAFVSLNNIGLASLLALTAYIAGYGASAIGLTLLYTGIVFLIMSRFAGFAEVEPVDLMATYAAQGLAMFTGGVIVFFTGMTRALLLLLNTFLFGVAGAFSGDRVLTISTYIAGFFATAFAIWQMAVFAHHPWLFGFGGALIMLINAWNCRSEIRNSPVARTSIVFSTACYCVLAIGLVFTALCTVMSDAALPPALALASIGLTFVIYYFAIYELPALAQVLLLAALFLVLFPTETGEEMPWWTMSWVGGITLLLLTWWSRQRITKSGAWVGTLKFGYALALVYLAVITIRPYLDAQGWMIAEGLLSLVFLLYGAWFRVWTIAAVGQIFLVLALNHLFFPPDSDVFPWTWWAAAVPVAVTFATGRAAHEWLRLSTDIRGTRREALNYTAYAYKLVALAGLICSILALVPEPSLIPAFLFLGTFLLSMNVQRPDTFGIRCSFALSATGMLLYFGHVYTEGRELATPGNAFAMFVFLSQTALLRHEGQLLVTRLESWALIFFAVATNWLFVSAWVWTRLGPRDLTLGWALLALFLFVFGLITRERRLRWCGMAIVIAAILRVICWDMWDLPNGFRFLTFLFLAMTTLVIGFAILRRGDRNSRLSEESPDNL
jgi:Predicted membrane protein (DUF2339)